MLFSALIYQQLTLTLRSLPDRHPSSLHVVNVTLPRCRHVPLVPNLVRRDAAPKVHPNFVPTANLHRFRHREEHREPRAKPARVRVRVDADGDVFVQDRVEIAGESVHHAVEGRLERETGRAAVVDDGRWVRVDKFEQRLGGVDVVHVLQVGHVRTLHVAGRDDAVLGVGTLLQRADLVVDLGRHNRVEVGG